MNYSSTAHYVNLSHSRQFVIRHNVMTTSHIHLSEKCSGVYSSGVVSAPGQADMLVSTELS
jgi:hypothetical protein